jgi:formiminotetrahydrofolate cyclodeaminase
VSTEDDDIKAMADRTAMASPPEGAAALAVAVIQGATAVIESVARNSMASWPDAGGAAIQAGSLRARAHRAGRANVRAYRAARALLEEGAHTERTGRDAALRAALIEAADRLLEIAAAGGDAAHLAAEIASRCEPAWRADAAGASALAAAAARTATGLLEVNLALSAADPRRRQAYAIVAVADAAQHRAREAVGDG